MRSSNRYPFTYGNGRIGRALINTVLRRRGATTGVVVPLTSALVARRDHYFDVLTAYRRGEIRPLIATVSRAARIAASEARVTAAKLRSLLPSNPIVSAEDAGNLVDASRSSIFTSISRLRDAGVLRPLTDRQRDQVWGAGLILEERDDLGMRIEHASRDEMP